ERDHRAERMAASEPIDQPFGCRMGFWRRTALPQNTSVLQVLKRLEPWMAPSDFGALIDDQTRLSEVLEQDGPIFAKVPMRINSIHPVEDFWNRRYMPVAIAASQQYKSNGKDVRDVLLICVNLERVRDSTASPILLKS